MIDFIKRFFQAVEGEQGKLPDDLAVAASVILLEIAYSDNEFTDEERELIINVLRADFNLSDEETHALISLGEKIIAEDTNKWRYIEIINNNYSNEEKIELIEKVWKLIYADDKLDKYEDHLVHRLSKIIHIPHRKLIEAKLKVKESM
jgi:uncharacterized tellurite resistance protein B-like protein